MPDVNVLDSSGRPVGSVVLAESVFGAPVREDLVHQAIVCQLASKRAGTHQAKTRGQVVGGGRKPYRQKGTGRARQGSRTAPHWRGGGVAFPPVPRDYAKALPRRQRRMALASAWSDHVAGGTLLVLDDLTPAEPKTRLLAETLTAALAEHTARVGAELTPPARAEDDSRPPRRARSRQRVLLMVGPGDDVARAAANLAEIEVAAGEKRTVKYVIQRVTAPYASVYDLVLADVVITSQSALERVAAEHVREASA